MRKFSPNHDSLRLRIDYDVDAFLHILWQEAVVQWTIGNCMSIHCPPNPIDLESNSSNMLITSSCHS